MKSPASLPDASFRICLFGRTRQPGFLTFDVDLPGRFWRTSHLKCEVEMIFGWGFVGVGKPSVESDGPVGDRKWPLPINIGAPSPVDAQFGGRAHFSDDAGG